MALADTLSGDANLSLVFDLIRTSGTKDNVTGKDVLSHEYNVPFTDGTSAKQASGFFAATFTATTGGINRTARREPVQGGKLWTTRRSPLHNAFSIAQPESHNESETRKLYL